jgi:hypothetical protein
MIHKDLLPWIDRNIPIEVVYQLSEGLYACSQQPFRLTSVLLDECIIPQPAFGTLLPCRKGEGTGIRVAIARHDEVGQQQDNLHGATHRI